MRLLGLFAAFAPLVASVQIPIHSNTPSASSFTLLEALSLDPNYTRLIRLLQRTRLIPTLARLNGTTLFAPTNKAIERHAAGNSLWDVEQYADDDSEGLRDNIHEKLRQELLYHMLNGTLPPFPQSEESSVQVHETFHYPQKPIDPPQGDPPPSPPWIPEPGGTLGGRPQRLRLSSRDKDVWVGVDAFGKGGVKVIKERVDVANGVLVAIDGVLVPPASLATVIPQHTSLSYFSRIKDTEVDKELEDLSGLTVFLPIDTAWDSLHPIERLYLESEFATDDLLKILHGHAVGADDVFWSESFDPGVKLKTMKGNHLEISASPDKIVVNGAELVHPDIYASNGVIHAVSSLLLPPSSLKLTPEKYLLALKCTKFVSLIHSVNLTSFINDPDAQITVLAPADDVISLFGDSDLPEKGSEELKRALEYHFIPDRWTPNKMKHRMLLETELKEPGLDHKRQVIEVEVTHGADAAEETKVHFGGVGTVQDHVEIGNIVVYFISRPIVPPADPMTSALPKLELSAFLAAIFSVSLADVIKTMPRSTILMPRNKGFERLGALVSDHLLSSAGKSDLSHVIMHHVVDGVYYSDSLVDASGKSIPTDDGSDIRLVNGSFTGSGGWSDVTSDLHLKNVITSTGVVHELSDVLIPRTVELDVGKLARAAKGSLMVSMVVKAGFDWVLNATAPPDGSPWAKMGLDGKGWTLLCPPDNAFKHLNVTELLGDPEKLREIVGQHLIPPPSRPPSTLVGKGQPKGEKSSNQPIPLLNDATYSTLLSPDNVYGDIVVRSSVTPDKPLVLGIKGARGTSAQEDWAQVYSWGRATTGCGVGGVIAIDRLLTPYHPPWFVEYGNPIGGGIVGVLLILAFFWGVRWVWNKEVDATYEPLDHAAPEEDQ